MFADLPVLIVHDWNEVTQSFLEQAYQQMVAKTYRLEKLFIEYWKKEIEKVKQKQIMEINKHYASYNEFTGILKSKNPLSIEIMKNHVLFGDVSKMVDIFWRREYERR